MHTLIERPPGQRKYLGENENFILGFLYEPLLAQTIKTTFLKLAGGLKLMSADRGGKSSVELNFTFYLSLLVSCCHYYLIFFNGMPKVGVVNEHI